MSEIALEGLRVFIVEDESLIAMLLEDIVTENRCSVVSIAATLEQAMKEASTVNANVAILDVNLNGKSAYSVAQVLIDRSIPFVFSTGYGAAGVPEEFRTIPILSKPFGEKELIRALQITLAQPLTKAGQC
ncbi:response regulator [Dyella acidiphila]|uniref:Response regulator n=1 Tax=Dyella acidiphila TaxID=2775866 RepID=A0ABR9GBV6_9GAMM|nr:response regulator [Dyella acidiphila]MBE1161515.1 response regulator [Dyella acidiphila]